MEVNRLTGQCFYALVPSKDISPLKQNLAPPAKENKKIISLACTSPLLAATGMQCKEYMDKLPRRRHPT